MFELLQMGLMVIGAIAVLLFIIRPLFDAAMYAIGYTILYFKVTKYESMLKKPFSFLFFILVRTPLSGFWERLTEDSCLQTTSISMGCWSWEPWFKYYKRY